MKTVYVFSGLGADQRAFEKIDFRDLDIHFILWISTIKGETLANYSKRIALQIKHENPIFIGLSFGGIVAQEIACQRKVEKILLISSVAQSSDLPFYIKTLKHLPLQTILPYRLLKKLNFLNHWLFGVKSSASKKLLNEIIRDTEVKFMKWAIDIIVKWKPNRNSVKTTKIHGDKDKILPKNESDVDFFIKKGGHFIIHTHFLEIENIIHSTINNK
jgi:pimeloyl-ACP methyl ester carboxylesterase